MPFVSFVTRHFILGAMSEIQALAATPQAVIDKVAATIGKTE